MGNVKRFLLIALFLCIFAGPSAFAMDTGSPDSGRKGRAFMQRRHERMKEKMQNIYAELKLTDEQKKQIQDNKTKSRQQTKECFEKMRAYREELNRELMKQDLDMKKINAIQAKLKTLQVQMSDERLESIIEIRRILSAEQFAKFVSLMDKHRRGPPGGVKD